MNDTLRQVIALIDRGEIQISVHGYEELAEDEIRIRDVMESVSDAIVVEDYPDYREGPAVLVMQRTGIGDPIHVVGGFQNIHPLQPCW